jgi:hypothetical protein
MGNENHLELDWISLYAGIVQINAQSSKLKLQKTPLWRRLLEIKYTN